MTVETFKPIVGYEGVYEVGDRGTVRRALRTGFNNVITNLSYGDREMNELDCHVARVAPHLPPAPF